MLKLREVLKLIEDNKTFAIDPENKVVLTKVQLGEMISADFDEAKACLEDGTLGRAIAAADEELYNKFLALKEKYSDSYTLIFHLQYVLAPRLTFTYRDISFRNVDKIGQAIYKRKLKVEQRELVVEALRKELFSSYLALRSFNEKFPQTVAGVIFAEQYVSVDEKIATDLLSAHLSLRPFYKYKGRKFYSVESLYTYLAKKGLLNKFSKTMEYDSVFFAWLFYIGKFDKVCEWMQLVKDADNYIQTKMEEY